MNEKKYEFTEETILVSGHTLHRIRALRDFGDIKAGDLGGFIEKEENLSHDGNAWVYNNARVFGDADVYGNAWVFGNAWVYENAMVYGNAWVYENAWVFGNAWVYENAMVCGNAEVYGNAMVYDNAMVYNNAGVYGHACVCKDGRISNGDDILCVSNVGSRNDTTTFFKTNSGDIWVKCGCFSGDINKFEEAVDRRHGHSKYAKIYHLAIEMAKAQINS